MKPARFTYHDPVSRDEALALLTTYADDAKILAGGQSLVPLLNMRLAQPAHLIDINHLTELAYIHEEKGGITIGALARHRDAEHSALVRRLCPLLAEAMPLVGHAPIRSRGTICGSLAHADPTAELPGVLLALGGHVYAESHEGTRTIAAENFFISELQTTLHSTELVTEVWFPAAPVHTGAAFLEICRRHGDFALVGVAAQITLAEDQHIAEAHLALVGVAPTPLRDAQSEELLRGELPETGIFREVAARIMSMLRPNSDIHASAEYRRSVAGVLVERALSLASERARQSVEGEEKKR
jgi:carbon-monoxide dehydrogenase medium subunit